MPAARWDDPWQRYPRRRRCPPRAGWSHRGSVARWPRPGGRGGSSRCWSPTASARACSAAGAMPAPARSCPSTSDRRRSPRRCRARAARRTSSRSPSRSRPRRSGAAIDAAMSRQGRVRRPAARRRGAARARGRCSTRPASHCSPRRGRAAGRLQLPGLGEPVQAHRRRAVRLRRPARRRPVAAARVAGPHPAGILAPFQHSPPSPDDEVARGGRSVQAPSTPAQRAARTTPPSISTSTPGRPVWCSTARGARHPGGRATAREALQPAYEQLNDSRPSPQVVPDGRPRRRRPRPSRPPRR